MNPAMLDAECKRLGQLLSDKGYIKVRVAIYINWLWADKVSIAVEYRASENGSTQNKFCDCSTSSDWAEIIAAAEAVVMSLPSIEDTKKAEFISALGKLIDQGREIGVEVDFLNPLTEMMKSLSSNIITHQITPEMPF